MKDKIVVTMGLFKRSKKKDSEDKIKTPQEIGKEQAQSEINHLKNEIKTQTDHLNSLSQKLTTVKEEYDKVIVNLMSAKKELNEKKNEFDAMKNDNEEIASKLSTARTQLSTIKTQYEQIKTDFEKFQKAKLQLDSIKSDIEKYKNEYDSVKAQTSEARSKLGEIQTLQEEHNEVKKKIEMAKKELALIDAQKFSSQKSDNPKHIIEAASSMVASANAKLAKTQQELDTLKKALEEERTKHQETKKLLDDLNK